MSSAAASTSKRPSTSNPLPAKRARIAESESIEEEESDIDETPLTEAAMAKVARKEARVNTNVSFVPSIQLPSARRSPAVSPDINDACH